MIRLSWCQFHEDCERLAEVVKASGKQYDRIVCITRGGVFVGGLLAHMLCVRNLTTIALKLYDNDKQLDRVEEIAAPDLPPAGSKLLVVDDLLDSGRTYDYIKEKWGNVYDIDFAVLYDKGGGKNRPTYKADNIPNEWVRFPWENPLGV